MTDDERFECEYGPEFDWKDLWLQASGECPCESELLYIPKVGGPQDGGMDIRQAMPEHGTIIIELSDKAAYMFDASRFRMVYAGPVKFIT